MYRASSRGRAGTASEASGSVTYRKSSSKTCRSARRRGLCRRRRGRGREGRRRAVGVGGRGEGRRADDPRAVGVREVQAGTAAVGDGAGGVGERDVVRVRAAAGRKGAPRPPEGRRRDDATRGDGAFDVRGGDRRARDGEKDKREFRGGRGGCAWRVRRRDARWCGRGKSWLPRADLEAGCRGSRASSSPGDRAWNLGLPWTQGTLAAPHFATRVGRPPRRPPRPLHSGGFSARGCRRARRTAQRHRQPARRGRRHFETRASRSVAMGFVGGTFFFIFLEVAFVFFVNWFFKAQHRQCVPPSASREPPRASPPSPPPRPIVRSLGLVPAEGRDDRRLTPHHPCPSTQASAPPLRRIRLLLLDDVGHHIHGADEPSGAAHHLLGRVTRGRRPSARDARPAYVALH